MKHELIKTEDYLLVVSNELPTKWYYDTYLKDVRSTNGAEYGENSITKKVLAHLPLEDAGYLDGVDVLPEIEDEGGKLAYERFGKSFHHANNRYSFREGYNKAKETYKYTFEDMMKCWNKGAMDGRALNDEVHNDVIAFNFIKSLNQPKLPIAFECEPRYLDIDEIRERGKGFLNGNSVIPKTVTNSEGRTEWVGKYLF